MLYIFSDEVPELDRHLAAHLGGRHTLTLIPATPRDLGLAQHNVAHFRAVGLRARAQSTRFYRDPRRLRNIVRNSDAVYLMGGNTFEYLAYAQAVGLFAILAEFEAAGGVILTESAGSIILSPNIATALLPSSSPDEDRGRLQDYRGMGRIPFHVSPHFHPTARTARRDLAELQALADVSGVPVMLFRDGEGAILEGAEVVQVVGAPRTLTPTAAVTAAPAALPPWAAVIAPGPLSVAPSAG